MKGNLNFKQIAHFLARTSAIAAAALALGVPAKGADLLEVLDHALQNDSSLTAAKITAEANQMLPGIARTAIYPTVTATATEKRDRNQMAVNRGAEGEIVLRQPVWNFGLGAAIRAAESDSESSNLELKKAEQTLYSQAAERYFRVLAAEDNLETARSEVDAIKEFHDLALQRLQVGLGTRYDLNDAQARLSQVNATEVEAEHEILSANLALTEIAGVEFATLSKLSPSARIANPQPDDMQWWVNLALENSVDIAIALEAVNRARTQIDIEQSVGKVRFDLTASHRGSLSGDGDRVDRDLISFVATMPLYQGGVVSKRTRQAQTVHRALLKRLDATKRRVVSETSSAYLDVVRSVNQVEALEAALVASASALQARVDGYNVGVFATVDVLNAQRDVFAVQRDLNQARYTHFLGLVALQNISGKLTRQHIEALNRYLM